MRIALVSEGTRGDLHPLLALADSLRAHGDEVVLCAPPNFRAAIEARGLEHRRVGLDTRAFLGREARAMTGSPWRLMRAVHRYGEQSVREQFARLPAATADVDRIVAAGIAAGAASAAELRGVPYRYVAYCPTLLPSASHPPVLLRSQTGPRWRNQLAWRANHALYEHVFGRLLRSERAALGLPPLRGVYRHLLGERPLLACDRELAPAPEDGGLAVEQTRCLYPLDGAALPPKLEHFLAQGPPPVYLGFGSMTDPHPERTTREVLEAVAQAGCRALVSQGWAGLGGGPLPEGVLRIGAVSHARLFPRTAAVVHHGGAGTTTTAARAGVPQLVVPHVLDQFYWASRVHALGVGPPPLARRQLRAAPLAERLAATLENELLAERAAALGARLRRSAAEAPDPALLVRGSA